MLPSAVAMLSGCLVLHKLTSCCFSGRVNARRKARADLKQWRTCKSRSEAKSCMQARDEGELAVAVVKQGAVTVQSSVAVLSCYLVLHELTSLLPS